MNEEDLNALAADFVTEYLERTPEYVDVAEFVDENAPEEDVKGVYDRVVKLIQKISDDYEESR